MITAMNSLKICVVCGDKANGYNFNVIACESCKAFFRRNALRNKDFRCPFNNSCEIDQLTRKFCQKCRLQKCLTTGMKKDLILSDEEKQLIKSKIAENKEKRFKTKQNFEKNLKSNNCMNTTGVGTQGYLQMLLNNRQTIVSNSQYPALNIVSNSSKVSEMQQIFKSSNSNPGSDCNNIRETVIKFTPNVNKNSNSNVIQFFDKNIFFNKLDEIFRLEYGRESTIVCHLCAEGVSKVDSCLKSHKYNGPTNCELKLNDLEVNRLNELNFAFTEVNDPEVRVKDECIGQLDVIKMTDQTVRRLIIMIKKLNGFKCLCKNDQVALMKASCTQLIILRSVIKYDVMRDYKDSFNAYGCDSEQMNQTIFNQHKRFMCLLSKEWESDLNILNLLSIIVLYNPNRPNIVHKHIVSLEQQTSIYLLHRYLLTKHRMESMAQQKVSKLMKHLEELQILHDDNLRLHLEIDARQIGHLLIDIFNLKS